MGLMPGEILDHGDIAVSTTIGTGTTKTLLNNNAVLTTSNQDTGIVGITPYQVSSAAYTAGQSLITLLEVESKNVPTLIPKRQVMPPILGGLGTFASVIVPVIKEIPFYTPLPKGNIDISYFGTAQIANTVAPQVGVGVHYVALDGANPGNAQITPMMAGLPDNQIWYDYQGGVTGTGTAAARVALGTFNINGFSRIKELYMILATGTVTASNSMIGYLELTTNDFDNYSLPSKYALQPIGAALGAAVSIGIPNMPYWKCNIPIKNTALIKPFLNIEIAPTAAGNVSFGCAFR